MFRRKKKDETPPVILCAHCSTEIYLLEYSDGSGQWHHTHGAFVCHITGDISSITFASPTC
jgi:hypothetical protein